MYYFFGIITGYNPFKFVNIYNAILPSKLQ